jgi:hypothetical protein
MHYALDTHTTHHVLGGLFRVIHAVTYDVCAEHEQLLSFYTEEYEFQIPNSNATLALAPHWRELLHCGTGILINGTNGSAPHVVADNLIDIYNLKDAMDLVRVQYQLWHTLVHYTLMHYTLMHYTLIHYTLVHYALHYTPVQDSVVAPMLLQLKQGTSMLSVSSITNMTDQMLSGMDGIQSANMSSYADSLTDMQVLY